VALPEFNDSSFTIESCHLKVFLAGTSLLRAYGGPALSVSQLAVALTRAGVEVGIWTPDQSVQSSDLLSTEFAVRRLVGTEVEALHAFGQPDLIHDNGIWLPHNHRLARLSLRQRVPRIVSTRGMLEPWALNHKKWKKRGAWYLYQYRDLRSAQYHHATAEMEAQNLQHLRLGVPIRVIHNGIEMPKPDPLVMGPRRNQRTALFLGRIHPIKGLPMLIEAWAMVRPLGWSLKIAGPDENGHRDEVAKRVSAYDLSDVISFTGALDSQQRQSAFYEASLFVLPSHSESFGMVVAEALAHNVPVLTTTATPWSMLPERGCGWWVKPTVQQIADGLRRATSNDLEVLRAMGEKGSKFVAEKFAWDAIAKRFIVLYQEVITGAAY
jgi:glycosyltransferase involved in cell wall biosynthesis